MPQRYSQKVTNTFIKGLYTEATEMTFPENASSDELNCDLLKNGSRRRRKGIVYEPNFQKSSFTVQAGDFIHNETWYNVSGLSGVEFLVIQHKNKLYFYDKSYQAMSTSEKSFSVDLLDYNASNSYDVAEEPISTSSINGFLIVVSPAINPIKIKYDSTTDTITVEQIEIKIRDLEYQYKGTLENNYKPTLANLGGSTSSEDYIKYKYDLFNIGWYSTNNGRNTTAFDYWDNVRSDYPPRNAPWWIGKDSSQNQNVDLFLKVDAGNTLAPNGHYILDFFSKNRSGASGIAGLPTEVETARFRTTAAFAGRVWYAGLDSATNGGKVFYSKVIENEEDFGRCYQIADPTSEDSASVVASDGGYISIPEASNIRALYTSGSIIYVFAQNGIWSIGGVDNIFKANEFYVNKISSFGLFSQRTLVNAMGLPIFWDTSGIYTIESRGTNNGGDVVNLISQPIKSFYDSIPNAKKLQATTVFDRIGKRVYWLFPSSNETIDHKFNEVLILDLELQAYFPWKVSDTDSVDTPYLAGGFFLSGYGSLPTEYQVLAGTDTVIQSSGNPVIQTVFADSSFNNTDIKFITKTEDNHLTFAQFSSRTFLDWEEADYSSYAETGFDFMGDATTKKNNPYITTYLKRTEENFISDGQGYKVDYPSSCILTVKWDLSSHESRWSDPSQIYRMVTNTIVNSNTLTFDYPYDTIVSRTKVRGKGRVLRLRFESETGKDFYLVGWESLVAANPRF